MSFGGQAQHPYELPVQAVTDTGNCCSWSCCLLLSWGSIPATPEATLLAQSTEAPIGLCWPRKAPWVRSCSGWSPRTPSRPLERGRGAETRAAEAGAEVADTLGRPPRPRILCTPGSSRSAPSARRRCSSSSPVCTRGTTGAPFGRATRAASPPTSGHTQSCRGAKAAAQGIRGRHTSGRSSRTCVPPLASS